MRICICAEKNGWNVPEDGFWSLPCGIINGPLFSSKKTKVPLTVGDFFSSLPICLWKHPLSLHSTGWCFNTEDAECWCGCFSKLSAHELWIKTNETSKNCLCPWIQLYETNKRNKIQINRTMLEPLSYSFCLVSTLGFICQTHLHLLLAILNSLTFSTACPVSSLLFFKWSVI